MGRAAAGYVNYKEGGVGPVEKQIVPLAQRGLFRTYAATLLEGPPIEAKLRVSLALVLLLRYDDVKKRYPHHRLIVEMKAAMLKCNVEENMFNGWITRTQLYNTEANKSGLSLAQVISILYKMYTFALYKLYRS